jgi:hypothetical protein
VIFNRFCSLADDFAKKTSQYRRNCGTVQEATNLRRVSVGVKCAIGHKQCKVKKTLEHVREQHDLPTTNVDFKMRPSFSPSHNNK